MKNRILAATIVTILFTHLSSQAQSARECEQSLGKIYRAYSELNSHNINVTAPQGGYQESIQAAFQEIATAEEGLERKYRALDRSYGESNQECDRAQSYFAEARARAAQENAIQTVHAIDRAVNQMRALRKKADDTFLEGKRIYENDRNVIRESRTNLSAIRSVTNGN